MTDPILLDSKAKFEAAKTCYQQQVSLLATMTKIDIQIMSGYLAVQLLVAGWAAKESVEIVGVRIGLSFIELILTTGAFALLWNSMKRRAEVAEVVQNLNKVLGFSVEGAYLPDLTIQPVFKSRFWFPWFCMALVGSLIGFGLVLWWPR